jgi:hypothetical protein
MIDIALALALGSNVYLYSSFVDCGPPQPGGASCNTDPARNVTMLKSRLARCKARKVRAVTATDGWTAFQFTANEQSIRCLRAIAPKGDIVERIDGRLN